MAQKIVSLEFLPVSILDLLLSLRALSMSLLEVREVVGHTLYLEDTSEYEFLG
jgi:hypothetical protein